MSYSTISDKELIEAISRKDKMSFDEFYNRYYRLLYQWAYRRTQSMEFTDEITQNFWISIWLEPQLIKTDESESANRFLLHHFTYRMLDFLKSSYVKTLFDTDKVQFEELEEELAYTHVVEDFDAKDFTALLNGILNELPEAMKEVFLLLYRDGYTIRETAQKLNINERTVKYKSKECVDYLKKALKKEGIDAKYLYLFFKFVS